LTDRSSFGRVFSFFEGLQMNTTTTVSNLANQAADSANSAIRSTQNFANDALERLSDKVDNAQDEVQPLISRLSAKAESVANRGAEAVRETSAQLRDKALRAQDNTVSYIKDEPVKSMLIAAATGAALMALVSLSTRSRRD
jgi:ElaB/YqjD/DUF883 family membrane-anchored ribosome-binding protein